MFKILYFGKDDVFMNGYQDKLDELKLSSEVRLEERFFKDDEEKSKVANLVGEIAQENYQAILIDFSVAKDSVSLLARHLRLSLNPEQVALIGLLNQVGNENEEYNKNLIKKDFLQASLTHIPIIHYKGVSFSHTVFDTLYLAKNEKKTRGEFATYSNLCEKVNARYFSSITHIMEEALILESSLELEKGQCVRFESNFLQHLNNKDLFVENVSDDLLQTKFKHRYRFSMLEPPKDLDEITEDKKKDDPWADSKYKLVDTHYLSKYIASIDKSGSHKKVKLLLVQKGLEVLAQMEKSLSELPYLIRYQTSFRKDLKIIKNFRPNILAVELEEATEECCQSTLQAIVQTVNEIEDYDPVINLFNCPFSNDILKEYFDYHFVMTHPNQIDLNLLMNMLEIFDKKLGDYDPKDNDPLIKEKESPFNVYALNPISRIKLELDISITSISEHEVTFYSKQELPIRGIVFINSPVKMYITVLPPLEKLENKKGYYHYFGIINGVTTLEVQILRQYINGLFTKEKKDKENEEKEDFAKLNEEKSQTDSESSEEL